ncbi:MAG: phage minor capsid protein [Lachnospiraceae bacterium]|nr:phage minor capsid protein [Lachnospiraceae bacterium]
MKMLRADKKLQMEIAENTKAYKQEVQKIINQTVKEAKKAGNDLVAEAGNMAWNNDLSMWQEHGVNLQKPNTMSQLIAAFRKQTNDELRSLTKTTGFKDTVFGTTGILNMYQREMDLALLKVATGTFSYDQAVNSCVHRLAQSGLRSIDYANGKTYQLDTAVRMSVRTGMSQLSGKITEENLKSTEQDLVITSQHMGSRPEHADWQNKVFSFSGKSKKYPDFRKATGYGTVTGLKGAHCTHDFYPFWEGASVIPDDIKEPEPVIIDGKEYTRYQATQKQRKMERDIRATKREIKAQKALNGDVDVLQSRLRKQTSDYKQFSEKAGLKVKNNRLRVAGNTSDLNKYYNRVGYQDASKKVVHFVKGSNTIFEGKSAQEKVQTAIDIVSEYTDRESGWNGKVIENVKLKANGRFHKNGFIEVRPNVSNRTFVHETLHSCSAPYIPKKKYQETVGMEEAAV